MIKVKHLILQSRVFSTGHFQSHLDFALRGLPQAFMPAEQRLDYDWAVEQLEPAIMTLDRMRINLDYFTRGVTGAAMLTMMLQPETEAFWQALVDRQVHLDRDGYCATGLLYSQIERCRSVESITRRSDYQLYLYQTALGTVSAWSQYGPERRYRVVPPIPDAAGLIEQLARQLRARNRKDGCRPAAVIRAHTHLIDPPTITHARQPELILELGRKGAKVLGDPPSEDELAQALAWVLALEPDAELSHPAALAAAAVAIARYPQSRSVWTEVFSRAGIWCPNEQTGRLEANAAGMILRMVVSANRSSKPEITALALFERCIKACEMHATYGDIRRRIAPRVDPDIQEKLAKHCGKIAATIRPTFEFVTPYELIEAETETEATRASSTGTRRKVNRDAPGKRLRTGRIGERYFREHYAEVFPQFGNIELVDRRDHADGYDMLFLTESGQYVEVKTVRADIAPSNRLSLTRRQWETATEKTTAYWLVLVILADNGEDPQMFALQNPAAYLEARRRDVTHTQTYYEVSVAEILSLARSGQGKSPEPEGIGQRSGA